MDVDFANNRLRRCFEQRQEAVRRWGPDVGGRYVERINFIMAAENVRDLYAFVSLGFHSLKGTRRDQFAVTLTGQWRLILERGDDERTLIVVEVVDYHE